MSVSGKIIFNSIVLYVQLFIGVLIGLITTRIVLNALGETDFGIYSIIGGVVGMLGILNSNMANASMRFMAHSLGTGDEALLKETFNTTLFLHFVIGGIVVLIMEFAMPLLFDYLLNIPAEKIHSAKVIYHLMVVTVFISVISVPYDAVMNANENLLALSVVDILGYVLKLGLALFLLYSSADLLIVYGWGMLVIQLLQRAVKQIYSLKRYRECQILFGKYVNKKMIREILSFTWWNLFGSLGSIAVTKVKDLLINMFFGVRLNASTGIATTVNGKINLFSVSMTRAINPRLIKSEGGGDRAMMHSLTEKAVKFPAFVLALVVVPFFFEMEYLLTLWLKTPPQYVMIFCKLSLVSMMIEKFTFPITDAIRAVGDIKAFQVTETMILIGSVPISYFVFKMGAPPQSIYGIGIGITIVVFFERLYFGNRIAQIKAVPFMKRAILPPLTSIVIGLACCYLMETLFLWTGFVKCVAVFSGCAIVMMTYFWIFGTDPQEKEMISRYIKQILHIK